MSTATTPPTPENVAEMLTDGDNDYHDGNDWKPGLSAKDNVVRIRITPYDEDGNDLDPVHFRAVVVEGEQTPIVLPSGAAADYINGDDGYHWLTCGTCEVSLMEVEAGTSVGEIATEIAAHKCAEATDPADEIDEDAAAHVLWHHGIPGGWEPTGYIARLMDAIASAPDRHRARLAEVYPGHVAAMDLVRQGRVSPLQDIARRRLAAPSDAETGGDR